MKRKVSIALFSACALAAVGCAHESTRDPFLAKYDATVAQAHAADRQARLDGKSFLSAPPNRQEHDWGPHSTHPGGAAAGWTTTTGASMTRDGVRSEVGGQGSNGAQPGGAAGSSGPTDPGRDVTPKSALPGMGQNGQTGGGNATSGQSGSGSSASGGHGGGSSPGGTAGAAGGAGGAGGGGAAGGAGGGGGG